MQLAKFNPAKLTVPKLIVGDFNFANIKWYRAHGCGVVPISTDLTHVEAKFVNMFQKKFLIQHVFGT